MIEIESAAVIMTDWSRWIRRNNSGCQCLSLAQCEPPSSMCSSSTQAGNFRSATPSSSLLGIGPLQHVAHSFRSCIRRASLRPPRPALKLFHQYLRLPRRSRLECGKLHAHTCKIESRTCSLSYATKVRTRINNDNDDYNQKNFSEEASKGCFAFFLSIQ